MKQIVILSATYCPQCKALEREFLPVKKRFPKRVQIIQANKEYAEARKYFDVKRVPVLVCIGDETQVFEKDFPTADEIVEWFKNDEDCVR